MSLVVGGLRAPVVKAAEDLPAGWTPDAALSFALAALVGAAVVFAVERYTAGVAAPDA